MPYCVCVCLYVTIFTILTLAKARKDFKNIPLSFNSSSLLFGCNIFFLWIFLFLRHKFKTLGKKCRWMESTRHLSIHCYLYFRASSRQISAKTGHLASPDGITSVTATLANEPHYSLIFGKASHLCEVHRDGKTTTLACESVQLPN